MKAITGEMTQERAQVLARKCGCGAPGVHEGAARAQLEIEAEASMPEWAKLILRAHRMRSEADTWEAVAEKMRCSETDSGGARCTGDATDPLGHEHRYSEDDLP